MRKNNSAAIGNYAFNNEKERPGVKELLAEYDALSEEIMETPSSDPRWMELVNRRNRLSVKIQVWQNPPETQEEGIRPTDLQFEQRTLKDLFNKR